MTTDAAAVARRASRFRQTGEPGHHIRQGFICDGAAAQIRVANDSELSMAWRHTCHEELDHQSPEMLAGSRLPEHIGAMRETMRWTTFALCLAAVGCRAGATGSDARMRLTAVLRDSLGADAGASVGFKVDNGQRESHLYLTFDSTLVPNVPDSVFARRARDIALFALRHYEKASEVDSITVAARDQLQPGAWRVVHSSVFAVASLRAATPTPTPVSVDTSRPQESLQESLTIPEACDAFAKILTASATANGKPATEVGTPRDTSMSFGEEWHGRPESACRVAWRNEDSREAPLEDVLTRAKSGGWTERGGLLLADGPDGSVLAVSRGNVACVVSGSWDGGDDSDSTYVPSPGFEIAASCFANRPDRY